MKQIINTRMKSIMAKAAELLENATVQKVQVHPQC